MPSLITLANVPNQSFTINLDNTKYFFVIKFSVNIMGMDLSINDNLIISGQRMVSNSLLIPYLYLEIGNFALVSSTDDYPIYTQFGLTQNLYYFSPTELGVARATT